MKAQLIMKEAKLEVLEAYWDKHAKKLTISAMKTKDKIKLKMAQNIASIKNDVRHEFLKRYLFYCKLRHKIAFF